MYKDSFTLVEVFRLDTLGREVACRHNVTAGSQSTVDFHLSFPEKEGDCGDCGDCDLDGGVRH